MNSSNVVSYIELEGRRLPVYGCGLEKKDLKACYKLKDAKKNGICLDWLHNRCVYKDEECRFAHALPSKVSLEEQRRMANRRARAVAQAGDANRPEAAKRRPRVSVVGALASKPTRKAMSIDTQTTTTSICEDMSTSTGSKTDFRSDVFPPEISTNGWEEDIVEIPPAAVVSTVPAPEVHMPTEYVPTTLEPPVLSLNANAPEYTPTYTESNAGSLYSLEDHFATMSTSYTPAPSIHESVYGEPANYAPVGQPVVPSLPAPQYQPIPYVHPNTAAALQNLNAQLNAQVSAFNASRDQIRQYQTELMKVQQETAIMMKHHETAMQQLALEKSRQRMQYERQLEELRKQMMDALNNAKAQEQRALQTDARLKELESSKMEVVTQPAVSVQEEQDVPVRVPLEEVVHPDSTTTFFTLSPLTSLIIPPKDAKVIDVKTAPAKPLSERVLKQAPKEAVALEIVPEDYVPVDEPKMVSLEAVPEDYVPVEEPKTVALEAVPEATVPAEEPVRRTRKRRVRRAIVQAAPVQEQIVAEPVVKPVEEEAAEIPETPVQQVKVPELPPVEVSEFPSLGETYGIVETVKPAPTQIAPATPFATMLKAKKSVPVETQPAPAPAQVCRHTVTARQPSHRCIFEIFDKREIRKAGICMDYIMGLCKSHYCSCLQRGCECPKGRAEHAYKQVPWFNCKYLHEVPKVKKAPKISSEEQKYRERQLGVKKTRTTKRDRFNRMNKKSLEVARKRLEQRRNQLNQTSVY